jgi:hypothetical protein
MKCVVSIVGIVFIGIMFDMVYPNGKTNLLIRSIFGILLLLVILNSIFNIKFDYRYNYVDENLLESIKLNKDKLLESEINSYIFSLGIDEVFVEIDTKLQNNEYVIENIYIDISNAVLLKNFENINKYEVISNELCKKINIDKERIVFFG